MALLSLENIEQPQDRIIAALDQDSWLEAQDGLEDFGRHIGVGKVNSLADRCGLDEAVQRLGRHGLLTMIDFKIYDIDDTIRRRTREQVLAGGSMITIHAANTVKSLREAVVGREAALAENPELIRPWLLGVTVLTSIDDKGEETCTSIFGADRKTKVRQFAYAAVDAGFDAIVCSPQEAEMLKADRRTEHMKLVIPAIRPSYAVKPDEQATAMTPKLAIQAGADFLVIGRPLIQAANYGMTGQEAAAVIADEIREAV